MAEVNAGYAPTDPPKDPRDPTNTTTLTATVSGHCT